MATIFTRAKAARKVIDLFDSRCGISRSQLRCDARLELDLGVVGDDTYDLLEAMHEEGVDMTEFDCHDRITPEGMPALPMLAWLAVVTGFVTGFSWALLSICPSWPDWIVFAVAFIVAIVTWYWISRLLPVTQREELRVRDLILSVEAGHWKSPKAQPGAASQSATAGESK